MQGIDARAVAAHVLELGERVQAQELKCVELLRRSDEVMKRAHAALERSQRKFQQHSRELNRILTNGR